MRLSSCLVILPLLLASPLWAQDAAAQDAAAQDAAAQDAAAQDAAAQDAAAQDAAPPDGGSSEDAASSGCGTITYQGSCEGDTVRYCSAGEVRSVDCSNPADYPRGGPWVTCGLLDCVSGGCQGYWCVAKPGSACGDLGCDVSQDLGCLSGTCALSTPCDPESYSRSCDAALLTYCRYTVSDHDCSQGGTAPYTCLLQESDVEPCVGLEGAACDPLLGRLCVDGLICSGGHCAADPDRDAGPGVLDASDAAIGDSGAIPDRGRADAGGEEAPGCGCGLAGTRSGATLLLFLASALMLWRHRRRPV